MRSLVTALLSGGIFGTGLVVSGMSDPRNVIAFLDVAGRFNPSLIVVMVFAILVHTISLRVLRRRTGGAPVSLVPSSPIDATLLVGAGVFGVGWGLAGYCPGPAIVSLGFGTAPPVMFVAAVVAGIFLADGLRAPASGKSAEPACFDPT